MAETMVGRLEGWDEGGRRLCFLRTSRTTPRWVLAVRGREGCESQVKFEE